MGDSEEDSMVVDEPDYEKEVVSSGECFAAEEEEEEENNNNSDGKEDYMNESCYESCESDGEEEEEEEGGEETEEKEGGMTEEMANQTASIRKLEEIAEKYEEIRRVIEKEIQAGREKVLALAVRDVLKHREVDILEISKLHTKALSQVEYLIRLLEQLDGVLSYGDQAIRQQRKEINRKVQQMLEFSDKVVKKQEKLKLFIETLREKVKNSHPRKKKRVRPPSLPRPTEENPIDKPEEIAEESPAKFEPKHKIIDGVRSSVIRVLLPEDHHDLSINLNRKKELEINCGKFSEPLVFQIDSRRVNINHITYKIVNNNILELTLPKMFRRGDYEMFQRMRHPQYALNPFLM